ncbi:MAG: recombination protein RecR [Paludibacteraceae bacterium]|nr:recombination protein RecR [Paludibacteraceae bacterium]
MYNQYASEVLNNAVASFASLPGIGQKTALRMVLNMLRREPQEVERFANSLIDLVHKIHYCHVCHNVSEDDICPICRSDLRDHQQVCVVENIQDVLAIEQTKQYNGVYHVLGGVISPTSGIGPEELEIESLLTRIQTEDIQELILAIPATMDGDVTNFYIYRKLQSINMADKIKVTQLARGVAVGNELEYTDGVTLGRSIINRTPYVENQ